MLGRAILRQASRVSTRSLTTTPRNPATSSLPALAGRQRQQRRFAHPVSIINPDFRRLYSDAPAADEVKNGGTAPPPPAAEGDATKETEARLEEETNINQELERLMRELETKAKEAKDFRV